MHSKLVLIAAASGLLFAGAAGAQSADELLKSKGCLTCHAADAKKVGPSFKDIAAKHKADPKAADTIVANIKAAQGSSQGDRHRRRAHDDGEARPRDEVTPRAPRALTASPGPGRCDD